MKKVTTSDTFQENYSFFSVQGNYHTLHYHEADIQIDFEYGYNENRLINITSIHGNKRPIKKSTGLSLKEVKILRDKLSEAIDFYEK